MATKKKKSGELIHKVENLSMDELQLSMCLCTKEPLEKSPSLSMEYWRT